MATQTPQVPIESGRSSCLAPSRSTDAPLDGAADIKETDLARIKPGQEATIHLDMYPGAKLAGIVESISAGSGAVFSVLPPENATGNWVKVTQRFPVRINITSEPDPDRPLRMGATAKVRIDTTEGGQ